jgi:AraC family transcriptional regulator
MDGLKKFSERGYVVKETGNVYFTLEMDETVKWFEEILGWYYEIDERNSNGKGTYGCVYDLPREFENLHIAPFTGIHLFYGEPKKGVVAFIKVQGIESLYKFVKNNGWNDITEIEVQPWGSKMCTIKNPDGYEMRFFE